jgi:hypothetical protein
VEEQLGTGYLAPGCDVDGSEKEAVEVTEPKFSFPKEDRGNGMQAPNANPGPGAADHPHWMGSKLKESKVMSAPQFKFGNGDRFAHVTQPDFFPQKTVDDGPAFKYANDTSIGFQFLSTRKNPGNPPLGMKCRVPTVLVSHELHMSCVQQRRGPNLRSFKYDEGGAGAEEEAVIWIDPGPGYYEDATVDPNNRAIARSSTHRSQVQPKFGTAERFTALPDAEALESPTSGAATTAAAIAAVSAAGGATLDRFTSSSAGDDQPHSSSMARQPESAQVSNPSYSHYTWDRERAAQPELAALAREAKYGVGKYRGREMAGGEACGEQHLSTKPSAPASTFSMPLRQLVPEPGMESPGPWVHNAMDMKAHDATHGATRADALGVLLGAGDHQLDAPGVHRGRAPEFSFGGKGVARTEYLEAGRGSTDHKCGPSNYNLPSSIADQPSSEKESSWRPKFTKGRRFEGETGELNLDGFKRGGDAGLKRTPGPGAHAPPALFQLDDKHSSSARGGDPEGSARWRSLSGTSKKVASARAVFGTSTRDGRLVGGKNVKATLRELRDSTPGPGAYQETPWAGMQFNSVVKTTPGPKFGTGIGTDVFKERTYLDVKLNREPEAADGAKEKHGFGAARDSGPSRREQREIAKAARQTYDMKETYKYPKDGSISQAVKAGTAPCMTTKQALQTWDAKNKYLYPADPEQRGGGYGGCT